MTLLRELKSTEIIIMSKSEYTEWIKARKTPVIFVNLPAVFPIISCKADYLAYNLKGKIVTVMDTFLVENWDFDLLEFSEESIERIADSNMFLEKYKHNHPDFSMNDYERVIPNPASLVFMDCIKNCSTYKCAKEIAANETRKLLIIRKIFQGQQVNMESISCINEIIDKYRTVKGLTFKHQMISKMEFKQFFARFMTMKKVSAEKIIKLAKHMENHDANLLFVMYNSRYKCGFIHDFSKNLSNCCKQILLGDNFVSPKIKNGKRKRDISEDTDDIKRVVKTNRNITEIGNKIIRYGTQLERPFLKIEIPDMMPFELVLVFDQNGLSLKHELIEIIDFLPELNDSDFESSNNWQTVGLKIKLGIRTTNFKFTEKIWLSLEAIFNLWLTTKDFKQLNFGFQLIIFSTIEKDLDCTYLCSDSGNNLINTLIYPKISDVPQNDIISDEIYLLCIG